MTTPITITQHAYDRARERLSWKPSTLDRMTERAFIEGVRPKYTRGQLRAYIDMKRERYKDARNVRLHGEVIYFFRGKRLITLYQLPTELRKFIKVTKT